MSIYQGIFNLYSLVCIPIKLLSNIITAIRILKRQIKHIIILQQFKAFCIRFSFRTRHASAIAKNVYVNIFPQLISILQSSVCCGTIWDKPRDHFWFVSHKIFIGSVVRLDCRIVLICAGECGVALSCSSEWYEFFVRCNKSCISAISCCPIYRRYIVLSVLWALLWRFERLGYPYLQ